MKKKVAITLSSFGKCDSRGPDMLNAGNFEVIRNTSGRRLDGEEALRQCAGCVGIVAGTETYGRDVLEKLAGLKVISRCGAGMDNIDLGVAGKLGIKVFNTPDGPTLAVAELTVGLMLALLRKIPVMHRGMREGLWDKKMGGLISGRVVGIIGFGRIGRRVALLAKALGAEVIYYDPLAKETGGVTGLGFKELLEKSDIVSLHLSYSEENRNLLGDKEFSAMRRGAFLVNCSRGGIVDEGALYRALEAGSLAGAALDVFEREPYDGPLRGLDNVILTPHVGSYAKEARAEMEAQAVKNLIKALEERGA